MSTSKAFTYRIVAKTSNGPYICGTNKLPGIGGPLNPRLKRWVQDIEKSEQPGGFNEHIAKMHGSPTKFLSVVMTRQSDNKIVATYEAQS